jgi:hypothetical protein
MDIPVSLVKNESISLPLDGPLHVHITIPFSLLVKDFDPNTNPIPQMKRHRPSWWPTSLFGRWFEPPTHDITKIFDVVNPAYYGQVWPKLSALLFGREEPTMYCIVGSDAEDWERAGVSNLFWTFYTGTGVADDNDGDIEHARAVVLKASHSPCGKGGAVFTVEEMGEKDKAGWKTTWMDVVPYKPSAGESDVDVAMMRKNQALHRYMAAWARRPPASNEKESLESDSG